MLSARVQDFQWVDFCIFLTQNIMTSYGKFYLHHMKIILFCHFKSFFLNCTFCYTILQSRQGQTPRFNPEKLILPCSSFHLFTYNYRLTWETVVTAVCLCAVKSSSTFTHLSFSASFKTNFQTSDTFRVLTGLLSLSRESSKPTVWQYL